MLPDTTFSDLMFPGNTRSSGRHAELWHALISDRFLFQEVKKWIIGSLKASQLSVIEVLKLRDWDGLSSSLSGQIGWLTIQPFIHNPNETATVDTLSGEWVCVCVIHGMRWRWRCDIDDQSSFFLFWLQCDMKPNDEITFESTSPNPFLPELLFPVSTVT